MDWFVIFILFELHFCSCLQMHNNKSVLKHEHQLSRMQSTITRDKQNISLFTAQLGK